MRLELTTDRGEVVQLKLYRAGDATLTVNQGGDWRTAFLSRENVDKLRTFIGSEIECAPFVADPTVTAVDNFVMSWETAPMVPTVRPSANWPDGVHSNAEAARRRVDAERG